MARTPSHIRLLATQIASQEKVQKKQDLDAAAAIVTLEATVPADLNAIVADFETRISDLETP